MKSVIVISCFLANGNLVEPKGEYYTYEYCNRWVAKFENGFFPHTGGKSVLCWCHKVKRRAEDGPLK